MRRLPSTSVLLSSFVLLAATMGAACGDDGSDDGAACEGATCPGAPGSPVFAGVASVAPDRTGTRLRVTWLPATDDATPKEQIRYNVYVSTKAGRATSRAPVVTTDPGATSVYIDVSPAGVTHHVVVRALDAQGLEDANTVERSALATPDTTPPVFGGAKAARPERGGGATLTWDPATDDRTPAEGMRYVVIEPRTSRTLAVVEGKTEATLLGLGPPGAHRSFVVRALDAADNTDANTTEVEAELGPDADAPTFAGCGAITTGGNAIHVTWAEAVDEVTPPEQMTYEVYVSPAAGAPLTAPTATAVGQTSLLVTGLSPSTTYHVVCRARDAAGNVSTNTTSTTVTTTDDVVPPAFGGAAGTVDPVARTVTLSWSAGSDDRTTPADLVYAIYQAVGTAPFDFARPILVTAKGATSATLTDLPSRSALRWVVRARDAQLNEDANTKETTGTTGTSWSLDVMPLFAVNCAVVGCHAAPHVGGGISFSLSAYNAYESIYDVPSSQRPALKRVAPGNSADSYLYQKVIGQPGIIANPMPAPGTGNVLSAEQIDIIRSWIDQGAARN